MLIPVIPANTGHKVYLFYIFGCVKVLLFYDHYQEEIKPSDHPWTQLMMRDKNI